MTVPNRGWAPLPECSSCGRPTRRSTWTRRGGRCGGCAAATLPVVLAEERLELREWQETAARRGREDADRAAQRRRTRRTQ